MNKKDQEQANVEGQGVGNHSDNDTKKTDPTSGQNGFNLDSGEAGPMNYEKVTIKPTETNRLDDVLSRLTKRSIEDEEAIKSAKRRRLLFPEGLSTVRTKIKYLPSEQGYYTHPFHQLHNRIINALDRLPKYGDQAILRRIQEMQRDILGIDALGRKRRRHVVSREEGVPSIKRMLMDYIYQVINQPVTFPLGAMTDLSAKEIERIHTYTAMIANRFMSIPRIDFTQEDVLRHVSSIQSAMTDAKETYSDEAIDQLTDMTDAAVRRYIQNNVISPLLRDVLVNRGSLKTLVNISPFQAAASYAEWLKLLDMNYDASMIRSLVTQALPQFPWMTGMETLRHASAGGRKQNGVFVMNQIATAIADEESVNDFYYDTFLGKFSKYREGRETEVTSISIAALGMNIHRTCDLLNVHQEPIALCDSVSYDKLDELSSLLQRKDVVVYLIKLLAKLSNVSIEERIDLDFLTRYPEWSGLLQTDSGESDNVMSVTVLTGVLEPIIKFQYLASVCNNKITANELRSIFDEPNRADLQSDFSSFLYHFSLSHNVSQGVIRSVLEIVRNSREWVGQTIWDELSKVGIVIPAVDNPGSGNRTLHTKFESASSIIRLMDNSATTVSYYVNSEIAEGATMLQPILNTLQAANALGNREDVVELRLPFVTSALPKVDLFELTQSDTPQHIVQDLMQQLEIVDTRSIASDSPLIERELSVHLLRRAASEGKGLSEQASAHEVDGFFCLVPVTPYLRVVYDQLAPVEQRAFKLIKDMKTSLLSKHLSNDSVSIITNAAGYSFVQIDPAEYITIEHGDLNHLMVDSTLLLPVNSEQLRNFLSARSYSLHTGSIKDAIPAAGPSELPVGTNNPKTPEPKDDIVPKGD